MPRELPLCPSAGAVRPIAEPSRRPPVRRPPTPSERVQRGVEGPNGSTGFGSSFLRGQFLVKNFTNFPGGAPPRGPKGPPDAAQTLYRLLSGVLPAGSGGGLGHGPGDAVEDVVLRHHDFLRPGPLHDR